MPNSALYIYVYNIFIARENQCETLQQKFEIQLEKDPNSETYSISERHSKSSKDFTTKIFRSLNVFEDTRFSFRDTLITCIVNTLTCLLAGCVTFCILGHIALEQGTEVSEVVKSGPGLVFLTYPEVVLKLPGAPMWSIIFFIMLLVRNA